MLAIGGWSCAHKREKGLLSPVIAGLKLYSHRFKTLGNSGSWRQGGEAAS
jgi:hypothetical protein